MGKSKKSKTSVQESQEQLLERSKQALLSKSNRYPKDRRGFKVGDKVYSRANELVISEVIEIVDERFLVIKGESGSIDIRPWVNFVKAVKNDAPTMLDNTLANTLITSQRQLDALIIMYYDYGIELNPDYQRELVWSEEQKVKLIDSIFKGIDIGKFILAFNGYDVGPNDNLLEIVDGKQRLTTIIEFYEDGFRYNGKLFSELCWQDRNHFCKYLITCAESKEVLSREQRIDLFLRLNAGGTPQSQEHLKKVVEMSR